MERPGSSPACQPFRLLMMQAIDDEISPADRKALQEHLQSCPSCREEFQRFSNLQKETQTMKRQLLPEMAWDDYWSRLYNRLERSISWILISLGAAVLGAYGAYHAVLEMLGDPQMPGFIKAAIIGVSAGGVLLLISVIREKLMVRKHDKYKEIQR